MSTVNAAAATSAADVLAAAGLRTQATGASASEIEAASERFLTLLVTQIRNQDPLNPMDNAQVTSQLAQINTVQGIDKLNTTLGQLVDFFQGGQAMQAASMIGKSVLVEGDGLALSADGGVGAAELADAADQVTVTIKDGNGLVVRSLDLGEQAAGNVKFYWDGLADGGAAAVPGNYTFTVKALRAGEPVVSTALEFGTVAAVVRDKNNFRLDLGALGNVDFSAVKEIL